MIYAAAGPVLYFTVIAIAFGINKAYGDQVTMLITAIILAVISGCIPLLPRQLLPYAAGPDMIYAAAGPVLCFTATAIVFGMNIVGVDQVTTLITAIVLSLIAGCILVWLHSRKR